MSLRAQVDLIDSIAVPATWHKYDVDNVPQQLAQAQLPALVLIEPESQTSDFVMATFGGGQYDVAYWVSHILIWKPLASGRVNKFLALGDLIDAVDTYLAAAKLIMTQFNVPPVISVQRLTVTEGDAAYFARQFVWKLSEYL